LSKKYEKQQQEVARIVPCSYYVEQAIVTGCHKKPMNNPLNSFYEDDPDAVAAYLFWSTGF